MNEQQSPDLPQLVGNIDRQRYLGGSDAAALLGVDPYGKTPMTVYLAKRGELPKREEDEALKKFFARRKAQEPVIASMLKDDMGIEVIRLSIDENPNRYIDTQFDFMAAEIDFEFLMTPAVREHFYYRADFAAIPDGALLNGEIKTSSFFMAHTWGEEGSENIPINYAAQCMWGLMVTKRAACVVTALIGIDTLIGYPIMRDEETISALREKGADLWLQHILTGVPPDALNMNDLKLIYTNYEGRPVEATPSIVSMIDERIALAKDIKEREERRDELEFQVAKYITDAWGYPPPKKNKDDPIGVDPEDDALLMLNGEQVGSWRRQNAVWLDQQRLKAKHPELVREFTNTTPFRMLRRKKPKKGK